MPPIQLLPDGQTNTPAADPAAVLPGSGAASPGVAGSAVAPVNPAAATDPGGVMSPAAPAASAVAPGSVQPTNPSPANTVADPVRHDVEQFLTTTQKAQARDNIGVTGNYAELVNGIVPPTQLPPMKLNTYLGEVANEAAMLALVGVATDFCFRTDTSSIWVLVDADESLLASWRETTFDFSQLVRGDAANGFTENQKQQARDNIEVDRARGVDEAFVEYATMGWWVGSVTTTVTNDHGDATYAGFATRQGTYGVIRLDNLTGRLNATILGYGTQRDDHNVPSVVEVFDGRIGVAFTSHAAENLVHLTFSKSKNFDDWGETFTLATGGTATYPSFHRVGSDLQIWYRKGGSSDGTQCLRHCNMVNGNVLNPADWSAEREIYESDYCLWKEDPKTQYRYMAFTTQHPINGTDHNIYYSYIHDGTDDIIQPGGTNLGNIYTLLAPLATNAGLLVVDAGGGNNTVRTLDGGRNSANLPCVLYARFDKTTSGAAAVGTYYMGNYVNSSSTFAELALGATGAPAEASAGANFYFGGMCIHTDNPNKIYRISESSGTWTLDELVINGGLSAISSTTALYSVSGGKKLLRPYYENGWVFFTEFDFYTDYTNFGGRVRKIWVGKS